MGIKLIASSFPVQRDVRFLLYWCTYGVPAALCLLVLSVTQVCSGLFGQGRQGRCRKTAGRDLWVITSAHDFPHPISDDIEDLEQAAQGGLGVSFSGNISPGCVSVSAAPGDPALAGRLDWMISRGPSQP